MNNNTAIKILDGVGLKKTPGRIALMDILLEAKNPMTQQEIMKKLSKVKLNYVSIYRSLETFVQVGIIHRVESGDRIWRFALGSEKKQGHDHPHFTCRECGITECLDGIGIPITIPLRKGYTVERKELYLKGLCPKCSG
ncbi:MAG: hypothetical protein APF76_15200 [Desulfitibacter sp. BRH_c19]|nr:MAG: hypothetical protein APF76_15200 [Desulfitibacter sp. BRH_c19]